jgi:hypothetical protein
MTSALERRRAAVRVRGIAHQFPGRDPGNPGRIIAQPEGRAARFGEEILNLTAQPLRVEPPYQLHRSENLQTTPIAATVLGGDELAQKGVVAIVDLPNASPSLSHQLRALRTANWW